MNYGCFLIAEHLGTHVEQAQNHEDVKVVGIESALALAQRLRKKIFEGLDADGHLGRSHFLGPRWVDRSMRSSPWPQMGSLANMIILFGIHHHFWTNPSWIYHVNQWGCHNLCCTHQCNITCFKYRLSKLDFQLPGYQSNHRCYCRFYMQM